MEQRAGASSGSLRFLLFELDNKIFGLPLGAVIEVVPMLAIKAAVPDWPAWLAGFINLRGRTLPVVDLRSRLGLPPRFPDPDPDSIIIVARPTQRDPVGFIVDRPIDVDALDEQAVEPVDELAGGDHPVSAVARIGSDRIIVLDVDRLLVGAPTLEVLENLS